LLHQISIAPGQLFCADRSYAHCIRLNYGHRASARSELAIRKVGELATALVDSKTRTS
jgi:DNA-binding transcriptional MocR family regulator